MGLYGMKSDPRRGPPAGNARRVVGAVVLLLASCASPPAGAASRAGFCHHYLVWQETTDEVVALLERDGDDPDDWPESALGAWNYPTGRQIAAWDSFTLEAPADWTHDSIEQACG